MNRNWPHAAGCVCVSPSLCLCVSYTLTQSKVYFKNTSCVYIYVVVYVFVYLYKCCIKVFMVLTACRVGLQSDPVSGVSYREASEAAVSTQALA